MPAARVACLVLALTLAAFVTPRSNVVSAWLSGPLDAAQIPDTGTDGTGALVGRVVRADTGAPLAETRIFLLTADGRSGRQTAVTDDAGCYRLTGVAEGRYRVQATKPGFVELEFGQRRVFESGTVIELASGQTLTGVDVALPRGSVISGRVFNRFGEPAIGASVQALRQQFIDGRWELAAMARAASVDDRGEFRIHGLPPAEYFIQAMAGGFEAEGTRVRNAPTYYPGTADITAAQRVVVGIGQEVAGVDLTLTRIVTADVSGLLVDPAGLPMSGLTSVQMIRPHAPTPRGSTFGGRVDEAGRFQIEAVTPGDYVLYAIEPSVPGSGPGAFAEAPVTVSGEDVTGLILRATRGAVALGEVMTDEHLVPPFDPGSVTVFSLPQTMTDVPVGRGTGPVQPDWSFTMTGIGRQQLVRIIGLPAGWALQSVQVGGRDVTDTAVDFPLDQSTAGLRVTITDKLAELEGRATNRRGELMTDYAALVFAADPSPRAHPSRFTHTARPDQQGVFRMRGLLPGDYLAVALDYLPDGAWSDSSYLEGLVSQATRLRLASAGPATITLIMAGE